MTITRRSEKGAPLTAADFDANMDHLESGGVSVLAYGMVPNDSSTGTMTTNTAALQAAVLDKVPLYFPPGTWHINGLIGFRDYLVLHGAGQSQQNLNPCRIEADFVGPMFCQTDEFGTPAYFDPNYDPLPDLATVRAARINGSISIRDLNIHNTNNLGEIAVIHGAHAGSNISGCHIQSRFRGIFIRGFSVQISGNRFAGSGGGWKAGLTSVDSAPSSQDGNLEADMQILRKAWGLFTAGYVSDCDFFAWGCGIAFEAIHGGVARCRFETNSWGLAVGGLGSVKASGGDDLLDFPIPGRTRLHSMTFEGNKRGITVELAEASLAISNFGMLGSNGADYGVYVPSDVPMDVSLESGNIIGDFAFGGLVVPVGVSVRNVRAANSLTAGGGADTGILGGKHPYTIGLDDGHMQIQNRGNWAVNRALEPEVRRTISFIPDLHLRGLNRLNLRDPNVLANNLGGVVSVSNAATDATVAFRGAISANAYGCSSSSVVTDAGSTLPAGTYYYFVTALTEDGETGCSTNLASSSLREHTVAGGERVDITFHGTASSEIRRRVYRGLFTDRHKVDGFWEITSGSSFQDSGQAFDGKDMPRASGSIPSRAELDANYAVVATPSWGTTCWITAKATAGFTINFGTAAPDANQTVQWLMFRP